MLYFVLCFIQITAVFSTAETVKVELPFLCTDSHMYEQLALPCEQTLQYETRESWESIPYTGTDRVLCVFTELFTAMLQQAWLGRAGAEQ